MTRQTRRSSIQGTKLDARSVPKPSSSKFRNVKPIKITITPSKKSFAPSINTNIHQDACVNIYFNGELSASRIIRNRSRPDEMVLDYSGRRVDRYLEAPWVIVLPSRTAKGANGKTGQLTGEQRWDRINQMLREEADEWGYQGKWRDHMGDYLVELSGQSVPKILKDVKDSRFGIIDVSINFCCILLALMVADGFY